MRRLDRKVAIVAGAGRGVGRGIALAFAREGARVVVASRTESSMRRVVDEIQAEGGEARGVTYNAAIRSQVFRMVALAVEAFGTVDVLVNVAQGFGTENNPAASPLKLPLEESSEEEWDFTLRTGLMGTLWAMKAAFPYLKTKGGKVINFGSSAGQTGIELCGPYNATKEAIRGLSRTAAREWGRHGITVNVINPWIETDASRAYFTDHPDIKKQMLASSPLGRIGTVGDAGNLAIFLASGEADFITGMTIMLDGGSVMFA